MGDLLIPPSSNWFHSCSVDSLTEERILATAAFKNIVIYKLLEEVDVPPTVIKLIPHHLGKALCLGLYPFIKGEFCNCVCVLGDSSSLSIVNIYSGAYIYQHTVQTGSIASFCWASIGEEDVIVAVGNEGRIVVWHPKFHVAHTFNLHEKKSLQLVSAVPHFRQHVIVAAERKLLQVDIKNGHVLYQFKGHDAPIYCIKWCPEGQNPFESLVLNTRWKKDDDDNDEVTEKCGPFFATSDYEENVFVWDFNLKRYIVKSQAIGSNTSSKKGGKDKIPKHISLAWIKDRLYASSKAGEHLIFHFYRNEAKSKVVRHVHQRAVYNMEVFGNLLVSLSQERLIYGFDVTAPKKCFRLSTMGFCANTLTYSPHDANRLAIGLQDNTIRLVTFGEKSLGTQNFGKAKGKIISVAWHPVHESKLLFGTGDGQVGILDILSGNINTFSYFHKKASYKVEWGPLVGADDEKDGPEYLYAYSFGDKEIVVRDLSNLMSEPIKLDYLIKDKRESMQNVTEFSFSPDYRFLSIGYSDGTIKVYCVKTPKLKLKITPIRKTIQHILWKPPQASDSPYIFAVGSAENKIYIFNVDSQLKEEGTFEMSNATKELVGHTGRVVWLSWSPHVDGLLASASYDHTAQIWNANTGDPVVNYGGHIHRVFRVEFCPRDPDLVISFAEENCVHRWRLSKQTCKTPAESLKLLRELKPKSKSYGEAGLQEEELSNESNSASLNKESCQSIEGISDPMKSSKRNYPTKSYFGYFHTLSSRRRCFHHIAQLCLVKEKLLEKETELLFNGANNDDGLDDLIEEDSDNNTNKTENISKEEMISQIINQYGKIIPIDAPEVTAEEINQYLDFFRSFFDFDNLLQSEITNHESRENFTHAHTIHCWRGSMGDRIKWAAKRKQLDAHLVSLAPQVSLKLWEFACEAYAEQLIEAGEVVSGCSYLVAINKVNDAIDMLLKHRHFKEALAIAKSKLPFSPDVIEKIVTAWTVTCLPEGEFETAALLNLSIGKVEEAARVMGRRTEPGALTMSALLFKAAECPAMAHSTAIIAINEASLKNDFNKIELLLECFEDMQWFKSIYLCLKYVIQVKEEEAAASESPSQIPNLNKHPLSYLGLHHPFLRIIKCWEENGILLSDYQSITSQIKKNFAYRHTPTSGKQLWFLASITLTELILDSTLAQQTSSSASNFEWESLVEKILYYISSWAKFDQAYYFSRIIIPNGISDTKPFLSEENNSQLKNLKRIYILSEFGLALEHLQRNPSFLPWRTTESLNEENSAVDDKVSVENGIIPNKAVENGITPDKNVENGITPDKNVENGITPDKNVENGITPDKNVENGITPDKNVENGICDKNLNDETIHKEKIFMDDKRCPEDSSNQVCSSKTKDSNGKSSDSVNKQSSPPDDSPPRPKPRYYTPNIKFELYDSHEEYILKFTEFITQLQGLVPYPDEKALFKLENIFEKGGKALVKGIIDELALRNELSETTLRNMLALIEKLSN